MNRIFGKLILQSIQIWNKKDSVEKPGFIQKAGFWLIGLSALLWLLFRTGLNPKRAAYPCQQAALGITVNWLAGIGIFTGSLTFLKRGVRAILLFSMVLLTCSALPAGQNSSGTKNKEGNGMGIYPGRVVWVYNPKAALWTGSGNYWDASVNPQSEYDRMAFAAVTNLSGGTNAADAWDRMFHNFNQAHSNGNVGYQSGQKLVIKINQNNSTSHNNNNQSNGNPAMILALLKSLINGAGIPQAMITVCDPSRAISDNIYNAVHSAFSNVILYDNLGGDGRVKSTYVSGAFPAGDGVPNSIAQCVMDADYIINMPLLKGHVGQEITFGAKNFFGTTGINIDWTKNAGHPGQTALTAFMTSPNLGGKTLLWWMDATYPNPNVNGTPPSGGWSDAPFNGKHCSSIFVSMDGVAEESVSLDFLSSHYSINLGVAEAYIINAANAGAGFQEHWNNPVARQYNGNVKAGTGIELKSVFLN